MHVIGEESEIERSDSLKPSWTAAEPSAAGGLSVSESEGEEKGQGIGNLFEEIMAENSPNLVREIDMQVQKVQRVQGRETRRGPHQDTS